jgi:hypothetical protein
MVVLVAGALCGGLKAWRKGNDEELVVALLTFSAGGGGARVEWADDGPSLERPKETDGMDVRFGLFGAEGRDGGGPGL